MTLRGIALPLVLLAMGTMIGCDDGDEAEADRRGIGSECTADEDCEEAGQRCLMQFKGGYCGVAGCATSDDCPEASACIAHDDGSNYCFRVCDTKVECNANRSLDNEANCSANITFAGGDSGKACVPPSGA